MAPQTEKKLSIRPLGSRVVAQRLEQGETLKGGIILPDSAKKKQESARVVAVGPGHLTEEGKLLPMPVTVGDIILTDRYGAQEVTIDDEDYIIIKAEDIVAIVN
jgi:chaperonin GroES